jgi:hypothetical protein
VASDTPGGVSIGDCNSHQVEFRSASQGIAGSGAVFAITIGRIVLSLRRCISVMLPGFTRKPRSLLRPLTFCCTAMTLVLSHLIVDRMLTEWRFRPVRRPPDGGWPTRFVEDLAAQLAELRLGVGEDSRE